MKAAGLNHVNSVIACKRPASLIKIVGLLTILPPTLYVLCCTPRPLAALAGPLGLLALFLMIRSPEIFYYLIVFMIPSNGWRQLSAALEFLTVSKLAGIGVAAAVLVRIFARPERLRRFRTPIVISIGAYVFALGLSLLHAEYFKISMNAFRMMMQTLVFTLLTIYFAHTPQFYIRVSIAIVSGAVMSSLVGVMGFLQAGNSRFIGASGDPNIFAAMILSSIPFVLYLLHKSKQPIAKAALVCCLAANYAAIMLSLSRSILLVTAFVSCVIAAEYVRKVSLRYLGFGIIGLLILSLVAAQTIPNSKIAKRVSTLGALSADNSVSRRFTYLSVGADAFPRKPVIGHGLNSFQMLYAKSAFAPAFSTKAAGYYRPAHNIYLQLAVDAGMVGLGAFLWLCFASLAIFRRASKNQDADFSDPAFARACMYALGAFMLSLLFLSFPYEKTLWIQFGFAAAISAEMRGKQVRAAA